MIETVLTLPRATELDIARFEKKNDLTLPDSYRRFLLEQNGGRPANGEFAVPGWGVTVIDFFFGIGSRDSYDLQKHFDRLDDPRSSELLPIASDPGGWIVYLGVRGPHRGAVFFWDHKTPASTPVSIGDDFDAFAASLKPEGAYDDYVFGRPPRLWVFRPWFPYEIGLDKMRKHCSILNNQDLFNAGFDVGQFRSDLAVAQLKITLKTFETDCFLWESRTFVSERMRRAMALDPSAIQFFDVDSSQSAPLPRSMDYKIMVIPVTENVSDPSKSRYTSIPMPEGGKPMLDVAGIAVRPDAQPAHDLFIDEFFTEAFCTDVFALRVLKAGCTGVRFFDPSQLSIGEPMRFRTLRGVEEEGDWDPVRKIEHTKVVEWIN